QVKQRRFRSSCRATARHLRQANSIRDFRRLKRETMRRNLEQRLRYAELTGAQTGGIQIWIEQGDGPLRDLHVAETTRNAAEAVASAAGMVTIFLSEDDARL